jgi:hypothetical protein
MTLLLWCGPPKNFGNDLALLLRSRQFQILSASFTPMMISTPRCIRWSCFALCLLPVAAGAAADPAAQVGQAAGEWLKTRAETVRLQGEWASQRQLLESTVKALEERAGTMEDKRDNLLAKTASIQTELATVGAKNRATTTGLESTEARLKHLTEQLQKLRPSLPPRLSAALDLPFLSLAEKEVSLGERMQLAMTVLNRCIQFNRAISCGEEEVTPAGESGPKSLQVIYWGLSHGYALDRAAGRAWAGSPGPQGWHWEPLASAAPVARLIDVYNDRAEPEFVMTPVKLGHVAAGGSTP